MESLIPLAALVKLGGLSVVMAVVAVAGLALAANANGAPSVGTADLMQQLRARALNELGIVPKEGRRYRKDRIFHVQNMAVTDDATTTFFTDASGTYTASRTGHTYKENGCSLLEPGIVDRDLESFLVLAIGLRFRGLQALSATTTMGDVSKVVEDGHLKALTVGGINVLERIPLVECGRNLGVTPLLSGGHTALQVDGATIGQPGFPDLGYVLEPYERILLVPGQRIEATVHRNSGSVLAVAKLLRLELIGVREEMVRNTQ